MQNKWQELDSLNLSGYTCFMREKTKKGFLYHFSKQTENGKWIYIKSSFDNIEFLLENGLTQ